VAAGKATRTERITIMNEGGGTLKGTAIADVPWITLPTYKFETPFIFPFRLEIATENIPKTARAKGILTIITNGGTARVTVEYIPNHPEPTPSLSLDDRELQFCNLQRGEEVTAHLMIRNSGGGVLSGTVESESDWIEVKSRTIWTRTLQAIPIVIHSAIAPPVRQPVGRIQIRTSGGTLEALVSLHFRTGAGPRIRLDPPRIMCTWDKRGIIEETLTIHNEGAGILRGTIPSPVPWIKIIPSIFPVEKHATILIRINTNELPAQGTLTIPVPVITNAGRDTLIVEVVAGKRAPALTPPRRAHTSSRRIYRSRLIVYDKHGRALTLISSGRSGGEGEIYIPAGAEEQCAKIFHPHRRTPEIDEKLRIMVKNPPPPDLTPMLTWPQALLFDLPGGSRVIGYLMKRIPENTFRPAHLWYDELSTGKEQEQFQILSALTLARIVAGVHKAGHSIGDLRENNLLMNNTGDLILIDTDSFQIREPVSGKIFWSRVGTGEYLPPEHLDGSFACDGCDRRYGDHFALAVLIFRFLMNGVHPFQAKGPLVRSAPATTDKILLGYFAFESRLAGIAPPDYAPPYSSVPPPVKILFRETFIKGHKFPKNRPDAGRWVEVLSSLIHTHPVHAEKTLQPQPQHPTDGKEGRIYNLTDINGNEVVLKRPLYRVKCGMLHKTAESGVMIYLLNTPHKAVCPLQTTSSGIPPSIITASNPVIQKEGFVAGWQIRGLDREQYLPWHVISDPQSRNHTGRASFSFRHRIACCRNLISALISANHLNLPAPELSPRSVYVGPDASVRIFSLPLSRNEGGEETEGSGYSPAILIFQMLMDGYHPYHATGRKVYGFRSPEKRMKARMYPWNRSDPDLGIPKGAPSIEIIPQEILIQIEKVFLNVDWNASGNQEIDQIHWLKILDKILGDLICCTTNPDHWYIPGISGCPWCKQVQLNERETGAATFLPAQKIRCFLLTSPRISGFLMIPSRYRRKQVPCVPATSRWAVIHLPSIRIIRVLLPLPHTTMFFPLIKIRPVLLIPWKRPWIRCIPFIETRIVAVTSVHALEVYGLWQNEVTGIEEKDSRTLKPGLSLIDEMILTSTMDKLRGEGIGMKKPRWRIMKQVRSSGRKPVQIMLLPLYIPWPEESSPENIVEKSTPDRKEVRIKGPGKRIKNRLQKIFQDFVREKE
jgi:DNA-binding helix-hairpin-helix protein with protein kinase domain